MQGRIDVVGAAIIRDGTVLCAQRSPVGPLAGMWEFPGGKIEPGEAAPAALRRELREELRIEVEVGTHIATTSYEYDFGIVGLQTYLCAIRSGTPVLTEHAAVRWLAPNQLKTLDWAPADLPTVEWLSRRSGGVPWFRHIES